MDLGYHGINFTQLWVFIWLDVISAALKASAIKTICKPLNMDFLD